MRTPIPPIQAVLFDCDGVLVDSEPLACRVLSEFLADYGITMSAEQCRVEFTGLNPRGVGNKLFQTRGVNLTQSLIDDATRRFMVVLERDGIAPIDGLVETLGVLTSRGTRLAAASNSPLDELVLKLHLAGLHPMFTPHHYSGDTLGTPKPDPAVYLHAAAQLGIPPTSCVVIEDSPIGVRAGAAAGMRVLGFIGTHHDPAHADVLRRAGASAVFTHMKDLAGLLG